MLVGVGEKGGDYCLEKDKEIFPCLISALDEMGAYQNKYLMEQFVSKYNVDLNHPNLIQFDILRQKNGQNQSPADEFKEAYEEILAKEDEMDMCLMAYARQHIEEF